MTKFLLFLFFLFNLAIQTGLVGVGDTDATQRITNYLCGGLVALWIVCDALERCVERRRPHVAIFNYTTRHFTIGGRAPSRGVEGGAEPGVRGVQQRDSGARDGVGVAVGDHGPVPAVVATE